MYNEEQKMRFISCKDFATDNNEKRYRGLFRIIAPTEEKYGADVCTFNEEQIRETLDGLLGLRNQSKWARINALKRYIKWCEVSGVKNVSNAMFDIEFDGTKQFRQKTIANPAHMQRYLNTIFSPVEDETVDNVFRCYLWLAYMGILEDDLLEIKCSDVDIVEGVLNYKSNKVPIYPEAISCFKVCVECGSFVYPHPIYPSGWRKDRAAGNQLLRGTNKSQSLQYIRNRISGITKEKVESGETAVRLTHFRAWLSGLFYRTRQLELNGVAPDFSPIAVVQAKRSRAKIRPDKKENATKYRQTRIEFEYQNDYQQWKAVFDI